MIESTQILFSLKNLFIILHGENEPNPELDPEPDPELEQNSKPKPEQTLKPLNKTIPP